MSSRATDPTASADARWRAEIPSVDDGPRPLWSVMIPTHNCAEYVGAAIESVLAQDPGPEQMQIEVVDDCSADDVQAAVAEAGAGRVGFFQQPENLGPPGNFATALRRSRGHLIHLLHGDDAVRPGFYETMGRPFQDLPELGAAFCGYIMMNARGRWDLIGPRVQDEPGLLDDWIERVALQNPSSGGTVFRREVFEHLGGHDERLRSEDWEMLVRVAAHYVIWYEPEPLALYRRHPPSRSLTDLSTGLNVADLRRVIAVNGTHLPPERRAEVTARARELASIAALRQALAAIERGDVSAWRAQNVEAFRTAHSPAVFTYAAYYGLRGARHWLSRTIGRAGHSS